MHSPDQLAEANSLVGYDKKGHPLLAAINEGDKKGTYERFLGEVEELLEEFRTWQLASDEAGRLLRPNGKFWGEFFDVMTMLKAVIASQSKGSEDDTEAIRRIATQVGKPFQGDVSQLLEMAGNILEGDFYRNMEEFLQHMYALAIYTGETDTFVAYAWLHQQKDWQNRPSFLFQKVSKDFDVNVHIEAHLRKGLRLLRNAARAHAHMEVSLPPWLAAQFQEDLLDWRNSEEALARIKKRLEDKEWLFQLRGELEEEMKNTANPQPTNGLILNLLLAGGVPLHLDSREEHALNQLFLDPEQEFSLSLLAKS